MSTKIRLTRGGAKKRPYYRIVVTSSRAARDAAYIEKIGHYNPMLPKENPERLKLDADRAKHWLSVGAIPSDRVQHFLFEAGLVKEKPAQKPARKSKKDKGETPAAAPAAA
jgi:small subunit ribosomal protein S16